MHNTLLPINKKSSCFINWTGAKVKKYNVSGVKNINLLEFEIHFLIRFIILKLLVSALQKDKASPYISDIL